MGRPDDQAILIGLGANLTGPAGAPAATFAAALAELERAGVGAAAHSRLYASRPVPEAPERSYLNAVVRVETALAPAALLDLLHEIERRHGRMRRCPNAARALDLDLLAYGRLRGRFGRAELPHPRLADRAFVLRPLREVAPAWHHPETGESVAALLARLPGTAPAWPV